MRTSEKPWFDIGLFSALFILLITHYFRIIPTEYDTIALLVAAISGFIPVLISALKSLQNRQISVDLLASIALIASILSREWGSATFINLMLTSARLLDAYTTSRTTRSIQSILKLKPKTVRVERDTRIEDIPVENVQLGDHIIVKSGEHIAVDGTIIDGDGEVDQSTLTGESLPSHKIIGEKVWSGTLLASGSFIVRAERIGKDTTLEHIVALIENAQKSKARIKTTAEKFATWYIALVLLGSLIVYFSFHNLPLLLSLLLVACADDIAIAIPMGFLASIGNAARRGVVIKGSAFLEGITHVKTVIVDKTGTLTLGRLVVQKIQPVGNNTRDDLLRLISMTAVYSGHPASRALTDYLKTHNVTIEKPDRVKEIPGKGIETTWNTHTITLGSVRFIESITEPFTSEIKEVLREAEAHGANITMLAFDRTVAGIATSADETRPEIKPAIQKLRELGVRSIIMLTGDNEMIASRIATQVGITEIRANMLPQEKLQYLKSHLDDKERLAMVGDGVNDAASLALADIGIAMGTIGSDAAIEAADIALMKDDFSKIPEIIELGRKTMRMVTQNFAIWGAVNIVGFILVFTKILGPEGASAYNFLTDFIPIINSLRLFRA